MMTEPRLRPPRHRVDRRAVGWWTVRALVQPAGPMLLVGIGLPVCSALWFPGVPGWLGPLSLLVLVLPAVGYLLVMPRWRYRVHGWELGERSVYSATGWFAQRRRIAPIARVQTVDTVRGPIQRLFGLATVTVTTASTAGDVRIPGLSHADANAIADRIGTASRLMAGDAT
jgi:membrane protein YdbS with pleckstrin-like domain